MRISSALLFTVVLLVGSSVLCALSVIYAELQT